MNHYCIFYWHISFYNCLVCRLEMKTRNRHITTPRWRYNPFSEHDNHSWTITYSDKPYTRAVLVEITGAFSLGKIDECLIFRNLRENVKHRCWYRWAFKDGIIPYLHVNVKINLISISDCNRKSKVKSSNRVWFGNEKSCHIVFAVTVIT